MDRPALAVRLDSRDDMAAHVAAALNPAALHATAFTDAATILAAAAPELGSQVPFPPHNTFAYQFRYYSLREQSSPNLCSGP